MKPSDQIETHEGLVNPDGMADPVSARRMMEIREGQVCRLEIPTTKGTVHGTGFLIGPNVVLTNWHVVEDFNPNRGKAIAVFDYKNAADKLSILEPRSIGLAANNPILAQSNYAPSDGSEDDDTLPAIDQLDFAVLRLAEPLGTMRGWSVLPDQSRPLRANEPLTILQHPEGKPLKIDTDSFTETNANDTRLRYSTNTERGSSGSPCFDKNWNLVALHNSYKENRNQGVPAWLIRSHLERSGIWMTFGADAEQPNLNEKAEASDDRPHLAPVAPDPFFGREEDIRKTIDGLNQRRRYALAGDGGIGKTSIAAVAIRQLDPILRKDGVVMHDFYIEPSTDALAMSIVRPFVGPEARIENPRQALRSILSRSKPFIYLEGCENADDKDLVEIRNLIDSCPFLLTTRQKSQAIGLAFHEVHPLDDVSALELLGHHGDVAVSARGTAHLCKLLGNVPLALELAGAYLKQTQSSPRELADILEKEGLAELHLGERQKRSIPLLLEKTAARLSPNALDAWAVLGADAPQAVSITVIQATLQLSALDTRHALNELADYCLLGAGQTVTYGIDSNKHYTLKHRLIYTHGRSKLFERLNHEAIERLSRNYLKTLREGQIGKGYDNHLHCKSLMPHFEAAIQTLENSIGINHPLTLQALNDIGILNYRLGYYRASVSALIKSFKNREITLGHNHPNTIATKNNLAGAYRAIGDLENSEVLYRSALQSSILIFPKNHPSVLTCCHNLASVLTNLEEYNEALTLNKTALKGRIKHYGLNDQRTLSSLNNFAALLESMGEFDKALEQYRDLFKRSKITLGPEHPDTISCINNLASLLERLDKFTEAESLYDKCIKLSKKILGVDHPKTLTSISNLALLYHRSGAYDKAETTFKKVIKCIELKLGEDHPDLFVAFNNFAGLMEDLNRLNEALIFYNKSISGLQTSLGGVHPTTKLVERNLTRLKSKITASSKDARS